MLFFKTNLLYLRKLRGLSQEEMGSQLGFSKTTWSNYETGHSTPKFEDLLKLSKFFELNETTLIHIDLRNASLNQKAPDQEKASLNASLNASLSEELSPNSQQLYEHSAPFIAHSSNRKDVVAVQELIKSINAGLQGISGLLELSSQVSELRAEVAALKKKQAAG